MPCDAAVGVEALGMAKTGKKCALLFQVCGHSPIASAIATAGSSSVADALS